MPFRRDGAGCLLVGFDKLAVDESIPCIGFDVLAIDHGGFPFFDVVIGAVFLDNDENCTDATADFHVISSGNRKTVPPG